MRRCGVKTHTGFSLHRPRSSNRLQRIPQIVDFQFPCSTAIVQGAVNTKVVGLNPTTGAILS